MSHPLLDNLVRIRQLKAQAPDALEVRRLLALARNRLADARLADVSAEGRFSSAYTAAHAGALAILRWHGYRSENRFVVFQCLEHTLGWPASKWRLLAIAHDARNRSEYEGFFEISDRDLANLVQTADELIAQAQSQVDATS